jgi:two-component SAPR family response regulator
MHEIDSVKGFTDCDEALEYVKNEDVDVAFLDIHMRGMDGIELAKRMKVVKPGINIVFLTAYAEYYMQAMKMHASGYIMKPVNEEKLKEELEGLRYPVEMKKTNKIQVKCFGNFEVFYDGVPLKFHRGKSKELFAYLVDREGSSVNMNELNAILWEEDKNSYLRNLIVDIQDTLKDVGASDVFIKRHNECFIDPTKIDCDAYEYKRNNPDAVRMYRGEYMIQYDWPVFDCEN